MMALSPDLGVAGNVLVFIVCTLNWFNGIIVPFHQLQVFWRSWVSSLSTTASCVCIGILGSRPLQLYYLSPFTYLLGGMIIAVTGPVSVQCKASDLVEFTAPANETCASYAGNWAPEASAQLLNPDASGGAACQVCMLTNGSQYLELFNLNGAFGGKWGAWAIFLLFTFSNLALVYLFTWATRVKGWKLLYFI
jgi:hypothetical protein